MTEETTIEIVATDLDRAHFLQDLLINEATGEHGDENDDADYRALRGHFLQERETKELLPEFVTKCRTLNQFWQFIKPEFGTYAERRRYIYAGFSPFFDFLENDNSRPVDTYVSDGLKRFDEENVHSIWEKALDRRAEDPEGAITAARTLLETVCKHILDECGVEYDSNKIELPKLYKLTADELNLSPDQHSEPVFKQILGGCAGIVGGLGTLRNRFGDAHGQGKLPIKPSARHAELAVNLAGSMAVFLVSTWRARHESA